MKFDTLITLTPSAKQHIKKMIAANPNAKAFRLSIKKTGCSGYAYVPEIIEELKANDVHFLQEDVQLSIDPSCEQFIKGLIVDYVEDKLSLKQKKLIFINPNEKNRCGCGESFTVE